MTNTDIDINALSYWHPLLEDADLPTPKTLIIPMSKEAYISVSYILGGDKIDEEHKELEAFLDHMKKSAKKIGYPLFMRTDHTSGKHEYEDTCFVRNEDSLVRNIFKLAEFSEICCMFGLPYENWVLRELLPIKTYGQCPNYKNMPIAKEFRMFVSNGKVECLHPYWPKKALIDGGNLPEDFEALCTPTNYNECIALGEKVSELIAGNWSVDILETTKGLYIIDMAIAEQSYHWEGCQKEEQRKEEMASMLLDMGL